jgi:hypothetical protein
VPDQPAGVDRTAGIVANYDWHLHQITGGMKYRLAVRWT